MHLHPIPAVLLLRSAQEGGTSQCPLNDASSTPRRELSLLWPVLGGAIFAALLLCDLFGAQGKARAHSDASSTLHD